MSLVHTPASQCLSFGRWFIFFITNFLEATIQSPWMTYSCLYQCTGTKFLAIWTSTTAMMAAVLFGRSHNIRRSGANEGYTGCFLLHDGRTSGNPSDKEENKEANVTTSCNVLTRQQRRQIASLLLLDVCRSRKEIFPIPLFVKSPSNSCT